METVIASASMQKPDRSVTKAERDLRTLIDACRPCFLRRVFAAR